MKLREELANWNPEVVNVLVEGKKIMDWLDHACPEVKEPDNDQQQWLLWGN